MDVTKHEQILAVASRLFLREGVQAVAMNRVAAEAEVAPMTVYRQFGSKERLVAAVVEEGSVRSLRWLADRLDPGGRDPRASLAGLGDVLNDWLAAETCNSSLISGVAIELRGNGDHPAHKAVEAHRASMRQLLEDLAGRAGVTDPRLLAAQLQFLFEGAATAALAGQSPAAAEGVRALVGATLAAGSSQ